MNKVFIALALLLLVVGGRGIAGEVSGRRSIRGAAKPGEILRVRVEIDLGTAQPSALILSEVWPLGTTLLGASWQGRDFMPTAVKSEWCWLFGYGDGAPVPGNGVLAYTVKLPEVQGVFDANAFGQIHTLGETVTVVGDDDVDEKALPRAVASHECILQPGWNLLSLPWMPDETGVEELLATGSIFRLGDESTWVKDPLGLEIAGGVPFWVHNDGAVNRKLLICSGDDAVTPAPAAIPSADDNWLLSGGGVPAATYSDPLEEPLAPSGGYWYWDPMASSYGYSQETLEVGQAGWIRAIPANNPEEN